MASGSQAISPNIWVVFEREWLGTVGNMFNRACPEYFHIKLCNVFGTGAPAVNVESFDSSVGGAVKRSEYNY